MNNSSCCPNCRGTRFIADRALAGRLVCSSCGYPLSSRKNLKKNGKFSSKTILNKYFILTVFIFILIVFLI